MSLTPIKTLFTYSWQTTNRLLAQAEKLTPEAYHAHPGHGHGSLHDLFLHIQSALNGWRTTLETGRNQFNFDPASCLTLTDIKTVLAAEEANWQQYLQPLTEADFTADQILQSSKGETYQFAHWHVLHHLILHNMQHHAEIAQLLTANGESPGDIDFIFYGG